jgi:hypothetical protein
VLRPDAAKLLPALADASTAAPTLLGAALPRIAARGEVGLALLGRGGDGALRRPHTYAADALADRLAPRGAARPARRRGGCSSTRRAASATGEAVRANWRTCRHTRAQHEAGRGDLRPMRVPADRADHEFDPLSLPRARFAEVEGTGLGHARTSISGLSRRRDLLVKTDRASMAWSSRRGFRSSHGGELCLPLPRAKVRGLEEAAGGAVERYAARVVHGAARVLDPGGSGCGASSSPFARGARARCSTPGLPSPGGVTA